MHAKTAKQRIYLENHSNKNRYVYKYSTLDDGGKYRQPLEMMIYGGLSFLFAFFVSNIFFPSV